MKKIIGIVMCAAILLMAGCSSASEPITTVPIVQTTTTVGDIAGTIEGDRYVSHVSGIGYKLNGDYEVQWPNSDKRNEVLANYSGHEITGPMIIWDSNESLSINYLLDTGMTENDLNDELVEQMNSRSKYTVKSSEFVDYKVNGHTYRALKSVLDNGNGMDVSTLQIYIFHDNGLVTLITVAGINYRNVDKITKYLQFA